MIILPSCTSRTSRYAAFGDLVLDCARPARAPSCRWACSPSAVTPSSRRLGVPRERPRSKGYPGHGEGEGVVHVQGDRWLLHSHTTGASSLGAGPGRADAEAFLLVSSAIWSSHPCRSSCPLTWSLPPRVLRTRGVGEIWWMMSGHRELPGAVSSACPLIGEPRHPTPCPGCGARSLAAARSNQGVPAVTCSAGPARAS